MEKSKSSIEKFHSFIYGTEKEDMAARRALFSQLTSMASNGSEVDEKVDPDLIQKAHQNLLQKLGLNQSDPELMKALDTFEELRNLDLESLFEPNEEALEVLALKGGEAGSGHMQILTPEEGVNCKDGYLHFQFDSPVPSGVRLRILNNDNKAVAHGMIQAGNASFSFPLNSPDGKPLKPGWYVWSIRVDSMDYRNFFYIHLELYTAWIE